MNQNWMIPHNWKQQSRRRAYLRYITRKRRRGRWRRHSK